MFKNRFTYIIMPKIHPITEDFKDNEISTEMYGSFVKRCFQCKKQVIDKIIDCQYCHYFYCNNCMEDNYCIVCKKYIVKVKKKPFYKLAFKN